MTARPLTPLPVQVRPRHGETADSYIRRLARANHLNPSYLRSVVCRPAHRSIQAERLAAVSGRTVTALEHTLAGLHPSAGPGDPTILSIPHEPPVEEPPFFDAIRRIATANPLMPVRQLAALSQTPARVVLQALTPPGSGRQNAPARRTTGPMLAPLRPFIDTWLAEEPSISVQQIWERLTDEHDAEISYELIRGYVTRCRARLDGKTSLHPAPRSGLPAPLQHHRCQSKRPAQVRGGGLG